jgi:hypothetical protein
MSELAGRLSGLGSHHALKASSQNPLAALLSKECPTFSGHKINQEKRHGDIFSFYQ